MSKGLLSYEGMISIRSNAMVWKVLFNVVKMRKHLSEETGNVGIVYYIEDLVGSAAGLNQPQAP
jgi:hypothetical protein